MAALVAISEIASTESEDADIKTATSLGGVAVKVSDFDDSLSSRPEEELAPAESPSPRGSPAPKGDLVADDSDGSAPSICKDMAVDLRDEDISSVPNACTLEEAYAYRKLLRQIGPEAFVERMIRDGATTAKRLITAFGIGPPACLEDQPDEAYYPLLGLALSRELRKRRKLPEYNTIDDAVQLIREAKNIIVLTGAGISTSLGIPDFRSSHTGLYARLAHLGLDDPQDVFHIANFMDRPEMFFSVAKDILPDADRFTPTHAFIRLLQDRNQLLTNYTQNIDDIESIAGIRPEKLVQCHGSFATATCVKCRSQVAGVAIFDDIRQGVLPRCIACPSRLGVGARKRKRSRVGRDKKPRRNMREYDSSSSEADDDLAEPGVMKPDITFFGEALPDAFATRLSRDEPLADLIIVIGTSLKVAPVSEVVPFLARTPQLFIGREAVTHLEFDIDLLGECDVVVAELCRRLTWDLRHGMIPPGQSVQVETVPGFRSRHRFREVCGESRDETKVGV